jgi:hypothetical protein
VAWTYRQRTGELLQGDELVARGYSGLDDGDGILEPGEGRNDPAAQRERGVGPLPRGRWRIVGPPFATKSHGPYVLRLIPREGTETFGRSGFLIHGDSVKRPGTASLGCIIVPRAVRERIWKSGDCDLEVVEGAPAAERNIA